MLTFAKRPCILPQSGNNRYVNMRTNLYLQSERKREIANYKRGCLYYRQYVQQGNKYTLLSYDLSPRGDIRGEFVWLRDPSRP